MTDKQRLEFVEKWLPMMPFATGYERNRSRHLLDKMLLEYDRPNGEMAIKSDLGIEIACAGDFLNIWAREIGVEECLNPYHRLELRNLARRIQDKISKKYDKLNGNRWEGLKEFVMQEKIDLENPGLDQNSIGSFWEAQRILAEIERLEEGK